jgi:hypothetical protein
VKIGTVFEVLLIVAPVDRALMVLTMMVTGLQTSTMKTVQALVTTQKHLKKYLYHKNRRMILEVMMHSTLPAQR